MSECMIFPKNWEKFIEDCSFNDREEFYTNGSDLVPVFRVEQMVEHYFAPDNNVGGKWIPVSERVPKAHELVLCRWIRVGYGSRYGFATYQHHNVWYVSNEGMPEVTHWMPLPNPPEEVNDD